MPQPKNGGVARTLSPTSDHDAEAVRPTLRDVVVAEMMQGRHPERPILSRIAFVGRIVSKDDPLKDFLDDVVKSATQAAHQADPLGGRMHPESSEQVFIGGICVELQQHFCAVLESEPQYLLVAMQTLQQRLTGKKGFDGIQRIHIIYYVDDIRSRSFHKYAHVEGNSSSTAVDKSGKLEKYVIDVVHGLCDIGTQLASQGKLQVDNFLLNVKSTHSEKLPRSAFIDLCLECGLFLSLDEYFVVYGQVPKIVRLSEVVHPIEPPLTYEP